MADFNMWERYGTEVNRMTVPGGWLFSNTRMAMCFVPDPHAAPVPSGMAHEIARALAEFETAAVAAGRMLASPSEGAPDEKTAIYAELAKRRQELCTLIGPTNG